MHFLDVVYIINMSFLAFKKQEFECTAYMLEINSNELMSNNIKILECWFPINAFFLQDPLLSYKRNIAAALFYILHCSPAITFLDGWSAHIVGKKNQMTPTFSFTHSQRGEKPLVNKADNH